VKTVLFIILTLATVSCSAESSSESTRTERIYYFEDLEGFEKAKELEVTYGFSWPDSASEINVLEGGFQDPFYLIKFNINSNELDEFTGSTWCEDGLDELQQSIFQNGLAGQAEWWNPNIADTGCEGSNGTAYQKIGAAVNPDRTTVYISVIYS